MRSDKNIIYMKKAISLARRGGQKTLPNPMVGAVIEKNNIVVGEGFHKKPGEKHAEIKALEKAGAESRGATLYINLEPCAHSGLTPPCADSLIKARIGAVVCAMEDPDPRVSGRGFKKLAGAGIKVIKGVLEEEALKLNEIYVINKREKRPFVSLKCAMTLDGKIATSAGLSKWITSKESRRFVHLLRSRSDAVLTGIGTVEKDGPSLSARTGKKVCQPFKVIADSRGRISPGASVFKADPGKVICACASYPESLAEAGVRVIRCPGADGRVDISMLFKKLLQTGIYSVLVEAGGELNASVLKAGAVDKFYLFYAPKIFAGRDAPTSFEGEGVIAPEDAFKIKNIRIRRFAEDFLIEGYPEK